MRVQNEKTEARIQQHMQRFERLINKAGSSNARSLAASTNDEIGINITDIIHQKRNRLKGNIMKYSP